MRDYERNSHYILVISASASFDAKFRKELPAERILSVDFCKNAAAARQRYYERNYDLVVINFPLPDETGAELAFDIVQSSNAGVLLVAPVEVFDEVLEQVSDYGIITISKPVRGRQLEKAIRLLCAIQDKIQRLEQEVLRAREKTEELRIIQKAKLLLMEKRQFTEDEAHRYIGKEAMDHGLSRRRIAERILEES